MKKPLAILLSIFVATVVIGLGFRFALALNYIDFSGTDIQDIRWPVGQTLSFVQGGTERMRIDATTGNVVIAQNMTVTGSLSSAGGQSFGGTLSAPAYYDSNNTAYYVDPAGASNLNWAYFAGNVGIGTTGPDWHLVVSGTGDQVIKVNTTSGTGNSASFWLQGGATNAAWQIFTNRADLAGAADNLAFYKQLGTVGTKMVITDSGSVGIGTTGPETKLDVNGNTLARGKISFTGTNSGNTSGVWIWDRNDSNHVIYSANSASGIKPGGSVAGDAPDNRLGAAGEHRLRFRTATGQGWLFENNADVGVIDFDADDGSAYFGGNVGIGTTGPTDKLNVVGGGITVSDDGTTVRNILSYVSADRGVVGTLSNHPLEIRTNNAEVIRVTTTGAVGIGTTGPRSKLDIRYGNGDGIYLGTYDVSSGVLQSDNSFFINIDANNTHADSQKFVIAKNSTGEVGTALMTVLESGNVGIGFTNPSAKLDINGGTVNPIVRIRAANAGPWALQFYRDDLNGGPMLYASDSTTIYAYEKFNVNDLYLRSTGAWLSSSVGLWTRSGTNTYLANTGDNVGIGTTGPGAKLDVNGTLNAHNAMTVQAGAGNIVGGLSWSSTDNGQLYLNNGGATTINIMGSGNTYFNGGNVGIGTTVPGAKLQIYETATTGSIRIGGGNGTGNHRVYIQADATDAYIDSYGNNSFNKLRIEGAPLILNQNSGGNVGIGTTSPGAKLDIEGNLQFFTTTPYAYIMALNGRKLAIGTDPGGSIVVDTSGNVGIGTTGPVEKLQVAGAVKVTGVIATDTANAGAMGYQGGFRFISWGADAATKGSYSFEGYSSNGLVNARYLVIDNTGNVGIGTTAPGAKLHIQDGYLRIDSPGLGWGTNQRIVSFAPLSFQPDTDNNGDPFIYFLNPTGSATVFINTNTGNVGIGTTVPGALLHLSSGSAPTTGLLRIESTNDAYRASIMFKRPSKTWYLHNNIGDDAPANSFSIGDETLHRFTILSNGNVGIGTTSPGYNLSVNGNASINGNLFVPAVGHASSGGFLEVGGVGATYYGGTIRFYGGIHATNPGAIAFHTGTGAGLPGETVRITSSGNVGIGTTSPGYKLHVAPSSGSVGLYVSESGDFGTGGYVATGWFMAGELYSTLRVTNSGYYGIISEGYWNSTLGGWGSGILGISGSLYGYGDGAGVEGRTRGGYGVYGGAQASGTIQNGIGVAGSSTGTSGRGVSGSASGTSAYGVYGHNSGGTAILANGAAGYYDFYATGAGTDYGTSSSIRWKRNIQPIVGALDKVLQMRGVYYNWDKEHGGQHGMGMIAEEVGKVVPEIVSWDPEAPDYATGMDYGHLTPILVEAIKEQQGEIEILRSEILRFAQNDILKLMGRFAIDENGTLTVKKVVTDELELGGYCVKVVDGELKAEKGECR